MKCVIEGTSFKFSNNVFEFYLSFGGDDGSDDDGSDENYHEVSTTNLTKDKLRNFMELFLNQERCHLVFEDAESSLSIISNGKLVEFQPDRKYQTMTHYTSIVNVGYDMCKDAVIECVYIHLSKI